MTPALKHLDSTDAQSLMPSWISTSLLARKMAPVPHNPLQHRRPSLDTRLDVHEITCTGNDSCTGATLQHRRLSLDTRLDVHELIRFGKQKVPENLCNTDAKALRPGWPSTNLFALSMAPALEHFCSTNTQPLIPIWVSTNLTLCENGSCTRAPLQHRRPSPDTRLDVNVLTCF